MNVIRIEHPFDKKGFWFSKCEISNLNRYYLHSQYETIDNRHTNPYLFPTYWEDTELQDYFNQPEKCFYQYSFAFKTIDQFQIAFTPDEIKEAVNLGFRVLMLNVTDYVESKFQIMFKNPIETKDITSLFI